MVGESVDVPAIVSMLRASPATERRLGRQIGQVLAEQHTRIGPQDTEGWLPQAVRWPLAPDLVPSHRDVSFRTILTS